MSCDRGGPSTSTRRGGNILPHMKVESGARKFGEVRLDIDPDHSQDLRQNLSRTGSKIFHQQGE